MIKKITHWYKGEGKIKIYKNDPDSSVFIAPRVYTEYHWTAKIARTLVGFYLRHWQWLWGTALAIVGLYIAILSLK